MSTTPPSRAAQDVPKPDVRLLRGLEEVRERGLDRRLPNRPGRPECRRIRLRPPAFGAHTVAYAAFQELATHVSHRDTGRGPGDPVCDRLLARVAADDNPHMASYRNPLAAAQQEPGGSLGSLSTRAARFDERRAAVMTRREAAGRGGRSGSSGRSGASGRTAT